MAVMAKRPLDYFTLLFISILLAATSVVSDGENPSTQAPPTVQECRGHIENALKEFIDHQGPEDFSPADAAEGRASPEDDASGEAGGDLSKESHSKEGGKSGSSESAETHEETTEGKESESSSSESSESSESKEDEEKVKGGESSESDSKSSEEGEQDSSEEVTEGGKADDTSEEKDTKEVKADTSEEDSKEVKEGGKDDTSEEDSKEGKADSSGEDSKEGKADTSEEDSKEAKDDTSEGGVKGGKDDTSEEGDTKESKDDTSEESGSKEDKSSAGDKSSESVEGVIAGQGKDDSSSSEESQDGSKESKESSEEQKGADGKSEESSEEGKTGEKDDSDEKDTKETTEDKSSEETGKDKSGESDESKEHEGTDESESNESEEIEREPVELRSRTHVDNILGLDDESMASTIAAEKPVQITLKELKKMYESAVKPMEVLYKFKDISNRFVGDAEIFSKPMILFIGPWSSGKSSIINYLLDTEDTTAALKTGAEPQSNGFTVLMYGETEQTMDGIEIAADWTFSSLQKFGQSFMDRLQGLRLPNNLLRKVTIVDTPGIIENRKQQDRTYPFNDACQWFIDRADIIYIVFDPTKLDMGLEIEALFDQLKGRESQARILLNKADMVSPQELMKVQSTLLWNLSPLLGSSEPPTIYVGNFRSHQFLPGSPTTLFKAQEEALLQDLRQTIDGRVENKISFTRRHAVRVRNHAKMVDCYLNTYYNHKTFFSNKKKIADEIIENPQNYHIYEGLSTLTNISRYDLPDPDIYRDFFKVNPLYDFKLLASTCSYFKGCPLDKLDLAIAYELPELMGKYRKTVGFGMEGGKR